MAAPAHRDDRCAAEEARHTLDVERRGSDHQFQIRAARQQPLEHTEQQVDVERALVRLIDDERVIAPQGGVRAEFGEQQAIGHQDQPGRRRDPIGEAHSKSHRHADAFAELLGDARGQRPGGEPARLGVRDQPQRSQPEFKADLRQLGALAGTRITRHDDDLIFLQGGGDVGAPVGNRQRGIVFEN